MKKTYLLVLMLFVCMVTMAGPVTPDEARQKITKFMSPRRSSAVLQDLRLVATSHYQERENVMAPSFYVFNVGEGQGYIIAGADDRIPAVLGYSGHGTFNPQNMPANMQAWLKGYNDQMEYLNRHPEAAAPLKTVSGEPISPLIQTNWDQGAPYNNLCPMDGDNRSITGCVATAMAQIMYFWKYPAATVNVIPGYTSPKIGLQLPDIPAGTPIDWDNMQLKYYGSETAAQQQAVAYLMLLCGTTVQMDYSATFSGAFGQDVAMGLLAYFDYDAGTLYEYRLDYRAAAWNQKVYDELKAGRPVYYEGSSSGSGHAFVVDGYGGDDYFHVNWGWGGASDDYFLLSILDPNNNSGAGATSSADGYSFGQGAIFGVQPNTGVPPTVTPILTTQSVALPDGTEFTRTDVSENFEFKVGFTFYNGLKDTYTFDWSVGLFSTNGQLLGVSDYYCYELPPGYGIWNPTDGAAVFTFKFGSGVTDGTYLVKPVSRENGTEHWYADKGSDICYVTVMINDNTLTLTPPTFGLTGTLETTGKQEVGTPLAVNVSITNNGTLYNDQIFLLLNGKLVGGRHFDLDAGETDVVSFTIVPKTAGDNEISVCTHSWNGSTQQYDYTPFITGSVTIEAGVVASLSMQPRTKNAVYDYESKMDIVKEDKAVISIGVTNTGVTDYDNDVIVRLYKLFNETNGSPAGVAKQPIQLAAGATTTVELEFNGLEDGAKYFYFVTYMSEGQEMMGYPYASLFAVRIGGEEPKEESDYYLVSDLNGWSTTDKSYAFTKLSDDKTWEITFPGSDKDIYLKVAPASAYDDQATFWDNLLCAITDRTTDLQGTMVKGNAGAWLLEASNNAESYTMRIVPSEMTYEITYTEKSKPFEPEPPYYYIGTATDWSFDASKVFADNGDGTYTITIPAVYDQNGVSWFKIAPSNAIDSDGTIAWEHLYSTDASGITQLSGTMILGFGEAWARKQTDGAESYTITINPERSTIVIQPNIPEIVKFTVQAIRVEGSLKPGEELSIAMNVKNEGNVQTGILYLFINNEMIKEIAVDITPGLTKAYMVNYTPTNEGELDIKVTSDEAGENLAGEDAVASQTIIITGIELLVREMGGDSVSVFGLNGNKMAEAQGHELNAILKSLPKGVYIIRVGQKSKIINN